MCLAAEDVRGYDELMESTTVDAASRAKIYSSVEPRFRH